MMYINIVYEMTLSYIHACWQSDTCTLLYYISTGICI